MKRIFFFLLMMVSLTANAFTVDGISYDIVLDWDTIKIARVGQQMDPEQIVGDVVIPGKVSYEGSIYTVEVIHAYAFSGCNKMTSITIPSTIKKINFKAFEGCSGLKAVHIEDLVAWCSIQFDSSSETNPLSLAHHLFINGEEVKELVIPEGIKSIDDYTFCGAAITSIKLPSSVTKIRTCAFENCSSLTSFPSSENLKVIGYRAFCGCSSFKEITVSEGVEKIDQMAFQYCSNLTAIHLPQSLLSIGKFAFIGCNELTSIEIPNQVTELGAQAFQECQGLTSVKLSDNISVIDEWTFARCPQLKEVILPKNLKKIGDYAFFYSTSIQELTLPASLTEISNSALQGCLGLHGINVEEGNPKFSSEDGILFDKKKTALILYPVQSERTHYDVPNTVISIAGCAFADSKLTSITLPPSLRTIYGGVFGRMANLESIVIPSSVTSIGSSAFAECVNLKEIDLPNSVESLGLMAFWGCSSLKKVKLSLGMKRIEQLTFSGCTNLSEILIPDSVYFIGSQAFHNCVSLSDFLFPQIIDTIDDAAFDGCKSLSTLTIPNETKSIGRHAFWGCSGVKKLTIGSSVNEIGEGAFYGCDNIREVWSFIQEPFDVFDKSYFDHDIPYHAQCFPEAVTSEAILNIPKGTIEKYRSHKGWRDFNNISETIPSALNSISFGHNPLSAPYFDLQGRRIQGQPQKGMYIRDGKMYVK